MKPDQDEIDFVDSSSSNDKSSDDDDSSDFEGLIFVNSKELLTHRRQMLQSLSQRSQVPLIIPHV